MRLNNNLRKKKNRGHGSHLETISFDDKSLRTNNTIPSKVKLIELINLYSYEFHRAFEYKILMRIISNIFMHICNKKKKNVTKIEPRP